jgi:uracil-DNA glycosylase family 4
LESIATKARDCRLCPLAQHRTLAVAGEGPPRVEVMVIGEAPGREEDLSGRPFVGRAGRMLSEALNLAGVNREEVFVTNVVKCRPPGNRVPAREEIETCTSNYLANEVRLLKPKVTVLLGKTAIRAVTGLREFPPGHSLQKDGVDYICTYHPAALFYNRGLRKTFEEDIGTIPARVRRHIRNEGKQARRKSDETG